MISKLKKIVLVFVIMLMAIFFLNVSSFAQDHTDGEQSSPGQKNLTDPRFHETYKQLQAYNDRPSMDTTPIYFDMGTFKYKIPRNYIVNMSDWSMRSDSNLVTIRVTFPGFMPSTDKTKDCLAKTPPLYTPECEPITFWIQTRRLDPTVHNLSDDDHFNNARKLFHSQIPKQGPNGFEMYETGPDDARIETYRKKTANHTLLIDCFIDHPNGKRSGICTNYGSLLPQGGWLDYRLYLGQIKDAEAIDNGIRKLINSFIVTGEKQ